MSNLLLYVATVLLWGSTWLLINFQLGEVPPSASLVYRYAIAAALLFGWCVWRRRSLTFRPSAHLRFAALGVLLFGFNYICTYSAQQYINSSLNAIAFSAMVWMNILNARLFLGQRTTWQVVAGSIVGVIGVVVLFAPEIEYFALDNLVLVGAALSLGGAYVASLGNIVSGRAQQEGLPVLQSNAWGMFYGVFVSAAYALVRNDPFVFEWSFSYVSSLLYLAVFGSVVAFTCYLTLLGRIGAGKAGYAVVMFPAVAVVLSLLFEGLKLTPNLAIGIALTLVGNVIVMSGRRQRPPTSAPHQPVRAT